MTRREFTDAEIGLPAGEWVLAPDGTHRVFVPDDHFDRNAPTERHYKRDKKETA